MQQKVTDEIIDSIFAELGVPVPRSDQKAQSKTVTFWIPLEYRDKYDEIQRQSNGKFGKLLKEVIKRSIERVSSAPSEQQSAS